MALKKTIFIPCIYDGFNPMIQYFAYHYQHFYDFYLKNNKKNWYRNSDEFAAESPSKLKKKKRK